MNIAIEQAARNLIGLSCWQHPKYGETTTPFPWRCEVDEHVTILAADDQVLISDDSGECDLVFWSAFVSALNTLAETINTENVNAPQQ